MASTVDERVFLVAMTRLASNHTGTRTHLQRINVVQNALCQCPMGYDTIDHGLWECGLHCAGIYDGSPIKDILEMHNMAHFLIIKEHGLAHLDKCLRISSDP
jgi:hypothetical protein